MYDFSPPWRMYELPGGMADKFFLSESENVVDIRVFPFFLAG